MNEVAVSRRRAFRARCRALPKAVLIDMLQEIYCGLWLVDASEYPDAEVNGADFIDLVSCTFTDRKVSPKEIP